MESTSHGPRPGPAHQISRGWAAARPDPSIFQGMGHDPARSIKISEDGPRPGPAHHMFKFSRPGPSNFQSLAPARPGPLHFQKSRPGSARPGPARHNFQIGPARPGPDKRPMTSPVFFARRWNATLLSGTSSYLPGTRFAGGPGHWPHTTTLSGNVKVSSVLYKYESRTTTTVLVVELPFYTSLIKY